MTACQPDLRRDPRLRSAIRILAPLLLLVAAPAAAAPPLGGLTIPPSRVPNWYLPTPVDTSAWTVTPVHAVDCRDNTTNDQPVIQAAINAAGPNTIVRLDANCTYNLTSGNVVLNKSNIVLQGGGMASTILKWHHTSGSVGGSLCGQTYLALCGPTGVDADVNWTRGYAPGTTDVTVASDSTFSVGDWVRLKSAFPAEFGVGNSASGPNNAVHVYIARISAKLGSNVLRLDRPLRSDFSNAAAYQQVVQKMHPISNVGLESLTVTPTDRTNPSYNYKPAISVGNTVNSWVRDVKVAGWYNVEITTKNSARNLYDRIWLSDLFFHPWNEAAFSFDSGAIDSVVQNSIFTRNFVDVKFQVGASGNAWIYNYQRRAGVDECHVASTSGSGNGGQERAIFFHGLANETLIEGNDTGCSIEMDQFWGPQAYRNTLYRNRAGLMASDPNARDYGITTEIGDSSEPVAFQPNFMLNVASSFHTKFGNTAIDNVNDSVPNQGMWFERNLTVGQLKLRPRADTTRTNNLSGVASAATAWSGFAAPPSLIYVGSKPAWWLAAPWPGIGADVDVINGTLRKLPAQCRFEGSTSGDCAGAPIGGGEPTPPAPPVLLP